MHRINREKWRLLTLLTVFFIIGVGIYFLIVTVGESKRLEQALIDQYGWANTYTPPADGFLAPQRAEAFIRVRQAVQPGCDIFQGILDDIIGLENLESDENMSVSEKTTTGFMAFKNMFSAAPGLLEFMDARNTALLQEQMGLGEYLYIYLAAYGPQLAKEPDSIYAEMDDAYISSRSRDEFIQILDNQLTALEANDNPAGLAEELRQEMAALEDGSRVSPWPNSAPERTRESLGPYQQRLAELYCSGIVKTELLQKNRGLNFKG